MRLNSFSKKIPNVEKVVKWLHSLGRVSNAEQLFKELLSRLDFIV